MPRYMHTDIDLRSDEIRKAFSRLIANRNLYKTHRFCFFIDGLDEYEETRQEDYKDMVSLLCSWADAAPQAVKICVSSREYNVFMNGFSENQRLRVQDLTRGDMERYIRVKLEGMRDETEREDLVQAILDKANGIFLWVALVVKSLREQLEEGHDLPALKRELDILPDELEALFEYLLKSIRKSIRKRAYQTFAMILESMPSQFYTSLFSYSFLGEYEINPQFAMQSPFPKGDMADTWRNDRIENANRSLNGSCRGLVEVREHLYGNGRSKRTIIEFTHRSVTEFLQKAEVKNDMDTHLKDFAPASAISQLFLAEVRCGEYSELPEALSRDLYSLIGMLNKRPIEPPPFLFREFLHSVVLGVKGQDGDDPNIGLGIIWTHDSGGYVVIDHDMDIHSYPVYPSLLHISAFVGCSEYVRWKIETDPATIDTDLKKLFLFLWSLDGVRRDGNEGGLKIIEILLERGLSHQTMAKRGHSAITVDVNLWQFFIIIMGR